jgi:hypothetical protein
METIRKGDAGGLAFGWEMRVGIDMAHPFKDLTTQIREDLTGESAIHLSELDSRHWGQRRFRGFSSSSS